MEHSTAKNEGKQTFILGSADAPVRYRMRLADGSRIVLHVEGESVTWSTSGGYWSRSGNATLEDGESRTLDMRLAYGKTYSLTLERRADALRVTRTKVDGTAVTDEIRGAFGVGNAIIDQGGKRRYVSFSTAWRMLEGASLQRGSAFRRVARPVVVRSGHAPRSSRHAARSATSASSGSSDDSDGGSDGPSDQPASPSLLLAYDNIDKRLNEFNEFHNEQTHKQINLIDKIDRLQLASAGLLFLALVSLIAGASR